MAHDHDCPCTPACPCMFRQVQVAGEFTVEPDPLKKQASSRPPSPFTGFDMGMINSSSKVIVSDLLTGVLPGCDIDVLLLPGDEEEEEEENEQEDLDLTAEVA